MKFKKIIQQKLGIFLLIFIGVYGLAIFQDYLFSEFYTTGFYLSESILYNTYWLFFIPFIFVTIFFCKKIKPRSIYSKIVYYTCLGLIFSVLHIFVFTVFFVLISTVLYENPHRFWNIFKSAMSNQLYVTTIIYAFTPYIINYFVKSKMSTIVSQKSDINSITIKQNNTRFALDIDTIQSIETDRPYSVLRTDNRKYLHTKSLKAFEKLLDRTKFIRVHRSTIINKNFIISLKSRKNGDYDATLSNGNCVRLSRHYRKNWEQFIIH